MFFRTPGERLTWKLIEPNSIIFLEVYLFFYILNKLCIKWNEIYCGYKLILKIEENNLKDRWFRQRLNSDFHDGPIRTNSGVHLQPVDALKFFSTTSHLQIFSGKSTQNAPIRKLKILLAHLKLYTQDP